MTIVPSGDATGGQPTLAPRASDLALAADPGFLERSADPAEFVIQACERAKVWLCEALEHGDISQIVEVKSQAEAVRVYTMQKQLGKDAQLSAAEIVRRAERGIGVAIRKGQETGEIRKQGERGSATKDAVDTKVFSKPGPYDFAARDELYGNEAGIYDMTDGVSDEDFDEAVSDARAEGNMARANVVRKIGARMSRPEAKLCSTCRTIKPLSEFGKRRDTADGRKGVCKICLAADDRERKQAPRQRSVPRTAKRKEDLAELAGIRDANAEHLYEAMRNAPRGAFNRPLIDRCEKVAEMLNDFDGLTPEDAVTMLPASRCREFTERKQGEWWLRFTELCEERRTAETPGLKPLRRLSKPAMLNPVLNGGNAPLEEAQLPPLARAVLDWLRSNGPADEARIGVGVRSPGVSPVLSRLKRSGLIAVIGKEGRANIYGCPEQAG